jgi:molybdopterin synthase sulfur carrier subunit
MKRDLCKVKVRFFGDLAEVFQARETETELESESTIKGLLRLLCISYERRTKIFDKSGEVRADINILRNGRNIAFLNGVETELHDGDVVSVFPRMFGG